MKRRCFFVVLMCLFGLATIWAGAKQDGRVWPTTRNIEVHLDSAPASDNDLIARVLTNYWTKTIGGNHNFYTTGDNSGGGTVAYEKIRNGPTDGSLIGFINTSIIMQRYMGMYRNSLDDFTIIQLFQVPTPSVGFFVRAESPYQTIEDLVNDAKARPGQVSVPCGAYGNVFARTLLIEEVIGVTFRKTGEVDNSERIASVLGGFSDFQHIALPDIWDYVEAGQMRMLAYFDNIRSEFQPDYPCVGEYGFNVPYLDPLKGKYFIVGPKGMDPQVVEAINETFKGIAEDQESRDTLMRLENGHPIYTTREQEAELLPIIDAYIKRAVEASSQGAK